MSKIKVVIILILSMIISSSCVNQIGYFDTSQLWYFKLDASGQVEWNYEYSRAIPAGGDMTAPGEMGYRIIPAADAGWIIVGESVYWDGQQENSMDLFVLIGTNGGVLSDLSFATNEQTRFLDIASADDGSYIATGERDDRAWVVVLNADFQPEWDITLSSYRSANTVISASSGFYFTGGELRSLGIPDSDRTNCGSDEYSGIWVMKMNRKGLTPWENQFITERDEVCVDMLETCEGRFILAGNAYSNGYKFIVVRQLDTNGLLDWEKTYRNSGFIKIYQLPDSNILLLNTVVPQEIILDTQGNEITNHPIDTECNLIERTSDGGYIVYQNDFIHDEMGDIIIRKLDGDGTVQWQYLIHAHPADFIQDMIETDDGGFILVGRRIVEDQNDLFR